MSGLALLRSYLYVPASEPHMIEKAMASDADALVLDLEDAVAPGRKDSARAHASQLLAAAHEKPIFVRINTLNSTFALQDIDAVASPHLAGLRLPKTESPTEIHIAVERLERLRCSAPLFCIIESALGVERAFAIASAHARVAAIGLGEADLAADLGVYDESALAFARSRIIIAARAARLASPVQSVYTNIRDLEGLRASTLLGKHMGFFGRSAIHPAQLAIINELFTPTQEELARAQTLLTRLERAIETGTGAFALEDGSFVDQAVVALARRTLALTHRADDIQQSNGN
jgi:citrate lyase subunit beta / citryl-CoA lyase